MALTIVASETISGDTFYRNKPFDISFSVTGIPFSDVSFYLGNSTPGIVPYTSNNLFRSTTGFPTTGAQGTLSVDVVMVDPVTIGTVGSYLEYFGTAGSGLDPSGYIYVANTNRHTIIQVDPSTGVGTVWAGADGVAGDANGPRLSARFRFPTTLTWDSSWNLYVTDLYRLRKVDSNGTVSLLAGSTTQGYVDSLVGSNAQLTTPAYPFLLPNGDILLPNPDAHAIRKVTQAGVVTTYAGGTGLGFADGSLASVQIQTALFVRGAGASATVYNTSDLSGSWSSSTSTAFSTIYAMHSDRTNAESNRILYGGNSNATYGGPLAYQIGRLGSLVGATGLDVSFDRIQAIAYDPSTNVYVAGGYKSGTPRSNYGLLPYVSTNGGVSWTAYASSNPASARLNECRTIAYGNGTWMAGGDGRNNGSVDLSASLLISTDGSTWTATNQHSVTNVNRIGYANGLWVVVGDLSAGRNIARSTDNGATWTSWQLSTTPANTAASLTSVAYGSGRWVVGFRDVGALEPAFAYSSDASTWTTASNPPGVIGISNIIYSALQNRFIASGRLLSIVDSNVFTSPDGITWTAASNSPIDFTALAETSESVINTIFGSAKFRFPRQLAMDSNGVMYLADSYNNRIRVFSNGQVGTYAGDGTETLVNGGNRLTSGVPRPLGLGFTSDGSMYISSFDRNIVQRIGGDRVTTFAGRYGIAGYANGTPSNSRFNGMTAITTRGSNFYIAEVYNGTVRSFEWRPDIRPIVPRIPANGSIVATSNYPISANTRITPVWTSVGGVLPLFKFEPFSNTITANRCGGTTNDTLTYTGGVTSTELLGYMAGNGTSNVTFNGPNGASTAYPYSLTLAVRAISNSAIVDDVSTTVTIGTARIIYSPCNANLVFYRNEPSPAPVFSLVASDVNLMYSGTTLPTGLAFTRVSAQAFALTGTPTVQTIGSNYTILAVDTASRTYTTQVSMVVNPERLIIDSEGSLTQSNIGSEGPIEPITFTARFPPYGVQRTMRYTWSPQPPAGIQFRDSNGTAIPGSNYTVTASNGFTLTLSGTITEEQLRAFALQGCNAHTITLTGTRTAPTPALSPSLPKTITFRFGETIFFTSNVPSLFVGLDVSGYSYTAKTYFPQVVDSSIQGIAVTDGFLPDGLNATFNFANQSLDLTGQPTSAGSYSFTLTASNQSGVSASLPVFATVLTDSVTVTSLTDACFNFIQYRSLSNGKAGFYTPPMRYLVTSASGCNTTLTGTNLPVGVTLDACGTNLYVLAGRPTVASGLTTATLTGAVPATGVSSTKTFQYSVSAEAFFFPQDISFNFIQNVPITPVVLDVSTLSENSVIRFSAPAIPAALRVTNTGLVQGTLLGSNAGTFDVTAFTAYTSGTKTYSYTVTPDQVLLVPSAYTTVTAPGSSVSIPINGYSVSATTVSNFRFQDPFLYGLTVNPTTGLLSGTLSSTLPATVNFYVLGNAGDVVGSLFGQIQTSFLARNVANMIGVGDQSTLRVYLSDNDTTAWTPAIFESSNMTAARIGINGAGTYLIPTSSDSVLRSTTGQSYTSVSLGQSAQSPLMTGIVYDAVSSTWWMGGTLLDGTRSVRVFKSTTDGLTWDAGTLIPGLQDRSGNASPGSGVYNAYLYGGVDLAYRDGILLVGGKQIARSSTGGATWTAPSSSLIEVSRFSLEQGTLWLAIGSSLYSSTTTNTYTADATTIVYSLDQGETWINAPGGFNMNAYEVVYGNGVWLASGLDWTGSTFVGRIRYSFDGLTWPILTSIPSHTYASTADVYPLGVHGAIAYSDSTWTVVLVNGFSFDTYTHPDDTPIDSGWELATANPLISPETHRLSSIVNQSIDPGPDRTMILFPTGATGPTFISPAQSTYVLWQYMPLPPITFTATGVQPIAYFISSLPVGLTWDSTTRSVSGTCMQTGTQTFTVYAVYTGIAEPLPTPFTVTLIVNVPRIIKKQGGAGAYTSLLRDYTEVNAAINARDTRVNPVEEAALGSFASPYAPDVVTPSNCPC